MNYICTTSLHLKQYKVSCAATQCLKQSVQCAQTVRDAKYGLCRHLPECSVKDNGDAGTQHLLQAEISNVRLVGVHYLVTR